MKKLDATGHNAMFGDNNINFNLQLDKFGVDTEVLKVGDVERVFRAWVEDWEEEARRKNDCVSEAKLLAKYEGLVFSDPSTRKMFSIWNKHMEFHRGERNGWNLIGVCGDDLSGNEDEPFLLEIAYALIGYTPQRYGIQVIYNNWA
jgi:hypothetical protein